MHHKDLQIVLRDKLAGLDPRMTISALIAKPLKAHRPDLTQRAQYDGHRDDGAGQHRAANGQKTQMIICDEAISALEVSIQVRTVRFLRALQQEFALSKVFFSHDLSAMRTVSNRIMVLCLGRNVELGVGEVICSNPFRPYTQPLISAVPIPDRDVERSRERLKLSGDLPSPTDPKAALHFLPGRLAADEADNAPPLTEAAPAHLIAEHGSLDSIMAGA